MQYSIIKGEKALSEAIEAAIASASSARDKLQDVLIAVQSHYLEHGDYTLVNSLVIKVDALKGFNAAGMVAHCAKYMGLTRTAVVIDPISGKTETPKGFNGHSGFHTKTPQEKDAILTEASKKMWWEAVQQKSAFDILDEDGMVLRLMDRLKKQESDLLESAPAGVDVATFKAEKVKSVTEETKRKLVTFFDLGGMILPPDAPIDSANDAKSEAESLAEIA